MAKDKDPAALFYIKTWLVATKEMKAEERGWYLNLILHQFDKGSLPNDVEELANLADVRVSEFKKFKEIFSKSLGKKFVKNSAGRLENEYAKTILQSRKEFKEKRSEAGKLSYIIKYIRQNLTQDENLIFYIKKHLDVTSVTTLDATHVENLFKHFHQLYINVNENVIIKEKGGKGEKDFSPNEVFSGQLLEDDSRVEDIGIQTRVKIDSELLKIFNAHLRQDKKLVHVSIDEYSTHLRNWLNTKPEIKNGRDTTLRKNEPSNDELLQATHKYRDR